MAIGDTLIKTLVSLENGDKANATVDFKIKSTDLKRFMRNLGAKTEKMADSFEAVGKRIQEIFIEHFDSEQGPDRSGNMIQWDAYSDRSTRPKGNWIDNKKQGGDKLMLHTGKLRASLEKGGAGNIHVVTKTRIEIGTDVDYAHYNQFGFDARNQYGGPYGTEDLTRRPIFGLTEEESDEAAQEVFAEQFFKDL